MDKISSADLGVMGERIATDRLESSGYKILERNYRYGHLEIDIIAEKNNTIVFSEVKTRNSNFFGEPFEFVTRAKQRQLIKAANAYIVSKDLDLTSRFDVFSIILNAHDLRVEHIENAFTA